MCGIAGANLSRDEDVNAQALATHLLLGIEKRGRHATGVAYFEDGQAMVQKADMPATEFVECLDLTPQTRNMILHTRWASQGSPKNNANNHPIDVGGILGIHNGVIFNDTDLFAQIGPERRIAEVDSEAIFASLYHSTDKAPQVLGRIEGSAAVAWLDSFGDPDLLHVSRISASPFHYAFTEAGSFLFASTAEAIIVAAAKAGLRLPGGPYSLEEGIYLRVREGEILTRLRYETFDSAMGRSLTATEKKALNLA